MFLVAGTAMLALISTDLNVLNFAIETVIVSFVIGMVLLSAGLYGRSRPLAAVLGQLAPALPGTGPGCGSY